MPTQSLVPSLKVKNAASCDPPIEVPPTHRPADKISFVVPPHVPETHPHSILKDSGLGFPQPHYKKYSPTTSSFLKPNSIFIGTQQCDHSAYKVEVELKEVDLSKSYLSGYFTIYGLTEAHPQMTTFFQGEIVGPHYSFVTPCESWGSNARNDVAHWSRFPSWRSLNFNGENDSQNNTLYENAFQKEYIYMRWKEKFLVPDAKITGLQGASFDGFYYICFNQLTGSVSGLYFFRNSHKFQQLDLCHLPDRGCHTSYGYE